MDSHKDGAERRSDVEEKVVNYYDMAVVQIQDVE